MASLIILRLLKWMPGQQLLGLLSPKDGWKRCAFQYSSKHQTSVLLDQDAINLYIYPNMRTRRSVMPKARKRQVSLDAIPYYHCVRRASLYGTSQDGSCSFEHRRGWAEERKFKLATIFSIDVCAYAVMRDHYHVV